MGIWARPWMLQVMLQYARNSRSLTEYMQRRKIRKRKEA
jgi:hypothetical protein